MHTLFIDADACPVKEECFRVAERVGFKAMVVSNGWINTRRAPFIEQVVVEAGPDVADDWIAERGWPRPARRRSARATAPPSCRPWTAPWSWRSGRGARG